ncbi:MAG: SBBP repeat-containing protein [Thermogutta sp.]
MGPAEWFVRGWVWGGRIAVSPRRKGALRVAGAHRRQRSTGRFRAAWEVLESRRLLSVQAWPAPSIAAEPAASTAPSLLAASDSPSSPAVTVRSSPAITIRAAAASSGGEWSVGLSRLLGGTDWDEISAVTRDAEGNIIVCGQTYSPGWVAGGFDTTWGGSGDAFVAKLDASGALLWAAYLGGDGDDGARGAAVDGQGNIYVAGFTRSAAWVSGGYDLSYGGYGDAFVAKLSPHGEHVWSTYLGGSAYDGAEAVVCDAEGNVYVAGTTGSSGWGYRGFDSGYNGGTFDGFLAKLSPTGARLWVSYIGGGVWDTATGLAATPDGGVVVVGKTSSSAWIAGGWRTNYLGGAFDGYALKASADGQRLWSTYLGGSGEDAAISVAVGSDGQIRIAGETDSSAWPAGITFGTPAGGKDAFVTALAADGGSVAWTTLLGGSLNEQSGRLFADAAGGSYLVGTTYSPGWCSGGLDDVFHGTTDGYLVRLDASGSPAWSSYLGGGDFDSARAVIDGGSGSLLIVGGTTSPDWPFLNPGQDFLGVRDGFLLRLDPPPSVNAPPEVAALIVQPEVASPGVPLEATALGVSDLDGQVVRVAFYLDADGDGLVDPARDILLGWDGSPDGGWTQTVDTSSLAPGRYTLLALAEDDQGASSLAAAAEFVMAEAEDRGTIDFAVWPGVTLGETGHRFFRFVPARDGVLTVEALGLPADQQLGAFLYDRDPLTDAPPVLAAFRTPDGDPRLDYEVRAGAEYFLHLRGDAAGFELRLTNLLTKGLAEWTFFGTSGDDLFEADAAAGSLAIQGVRYAAPDRGEIATVRFHGGPGRDVVVLRDGPEDDTVRIFPSRAEWTGHVIPDVLCEQFAEIYVYAAAGGRDAAELYDAQPDGGGELAVKFKSEPQYRHAKLVGPGLYHRVKFFEEVRAFGSGGNDQAVLFGSSGEDVLEARLGLTRFRGPDFDVTLRDFAFVSADVSSGGFDRAFLYDSPLKDEFHGKAAKSEMFDQLTAGRRYRITARYFDQVFARADEGWETSSPGGTDKAALWDTPGDELAEVVGDILRLYRINSSGTRILTHQAELFESVKLRDSSGGDDRIDHVAAPVVSALDVGAGWRPL